MVLIDNQIINGYMENLKEIEIESFLRYIRNNSNEIIVRDKNDNQIAIDNSSLIDNYREIFNTFYDKSRLYKIYGIGIIKWLNLNISTDTDLIITALDIKQNPKKYNLLKRNIKNLYISVIGQDDITLDDFLLQYEQ